MTKQITNIAAIMFLAMVLTVSAVTAQKNAGNGFAPIGIYTGVETSEGRCEANMEMCYGNAFVLNSFGEWESHHLSVSLDYSTNSFNPNDLIVMGGRWSLVIIRENQYAGTLYGDVQSGSVNFINDPNGKPVSKQVRISLTTTGGLGVYSGRANEGIIGVYDATTNLRSKETNGSATFNF